MARVVVGVDGSECSKEALVWAAKEAVLRGARLEVVCAFHVPAGWLGLGDGTVLTDPVAIDDLERFANDTVTESLSCLDPAQRPSELSTTTALGRPGDVLIDASKGADLLVVGSKGHGDIGSILLGSVGMHCVHHAGCPVVVVRQADEPQAKDGHLKRHAKA